MIPLEIYNFATGDAGAAARLNVLRDELQAQRAELITRLGEHLPAAGQCAFADGALTTEADFQTHVITDLLGQHEILGAFGFDVMPETFPLVSVASRNGKARRDDAARVGETSGARAAAFLDSSQTYTTDAENSHDTAVSASLRAIIKRLQADPETRSRASTLTLDQIIAHLRTHSDALSRDPRTGRPRPLLVTRDAIPILERAKNGEHMFLAPGGPEQSNSVFVTDEEVARLVWARSFHPNNAGAGQQMRQAIFDGLVDSWSKGMAHPNIVCVQGRVSRMVGALSLLDFDEKNWEVSTCEEIKNEIFEKCKAAINAYAEEVLESRAAPSQKMAAAQLLAKSKQQLLQYEEAFGPASDEDVEAAEAEVKKVVLGVADQAAAALNKRAPGCVPASMLLVIKNDLQYVV